ncbi:MAG TPA: glycosyltransferase [Flavobacterium sp.]|nr:glycosyltransferase [Flavobacterium sp.]
MKKPGAPLLSVILLSKTDSQPLFQMTLECINSIAASEIKGNFEIIIIESNKNFLESGFRYPDFVNVIIPEEKFNFHKFLNIGISNSKGDFIALCNNDLIFKPNWFNEIEQISKRYPSVLSFSPTQECYAEGNKKVEFGYKVRRHIQGWCIVVKKEIFNKIGLLDETFDFYFADNDYALTLKYHNLRHALVLSSQVLHLEKKSTSLAAEDKSFQKKYKIPKYLYGEKYKYILDREINLSGFLKYHQKWGPPKLLYRKNKLADIFIKYGLGFAVRFFLKIH